MASEEAAITMVNYYTTATPHLRNQPVFIQYSNHRELKTDNLPNQGVSDPHHRPQLRSGAEFHISPLTRLLSELLLMAAAVSHKPQAKASICETEAVDLATIRYCFSMPGMQ